MQLNPNQRVQPRPTRRCMSFLLATGVGCAECDDSADTLAVHEQLQPDWVLMDIEMSRMDGLTATRNIVQAFPNAKVVIVSKHSDAP